MLPCVVLAGGLFASSQLATVSLLTEARTRRLILPKVGTAIVGVFLNVLGAACYGMLGVVVATAVTAATHLIWISWLVRIGRSHTRAE
jgi:O-antigen/teichoic acid export membrane protein